MSQIASNLALANGRLGRYDEQLRWAGFGLAQGECERHRYKLVYYRSWALAMLGEATKAISSVIEEAARPSNDSKLGSTS